MSAALIILWVSLGALVATVALTLGVRATGAVRHRRVARYRAQTGAALGAFAAGDGAAPPPPRGRLQRRIMQRDLLALRPNLKGGAADELTRLFVSYGLVDDARRELRARFVVTRRHAAELLGAMPTADAEGALTAGLGDRDRLVRLSCARALAALGDVRSLPAVLDALAGEAEHPTDAVAILARYAGAAVPFLRDRLGSGTSNEQRLAARVLGTGRVLPAAPDLRGLLDGDDAPLVADAAGALGAIGDRDAIPRLGTLARKHPEARVRAAAATALGAIDDPAAGPSLAAVLSDGRWEVRDAAARALVTLGAAAVPEAVAHTGAEVNDCGIAHVAGVLDVADRLTPIIARAEAGDGDAEAFVHRACAGGASVRLGELAAGDGPLAVYCRAVLAADEARATRS